MTTATLERPAAKTDGFRIERSILIEAPASTAYALVEDFHRWIQWSPYEGLDPALRRTFEGPDRGVGAVYAWQGNNKVGNGRMQILQADPARKLLIKLDFYKPFEAHNTAEFSFVPEGDATRVTWAMYGPEMCGNSLMKFVMGLFFNMDKMVGGQFETGLAKLKAAAEAAA
jgi:hypothetical protein